MSKRTLESFFIPPGKKAKNDTSETIQNTTTEKPATRRPTETSPVDASPASIHPSYPWRLPHLPPDISETLSQLVTAQGKPITNQPHLDLLYFQPLIPSPSAHNLFKFLRSQLFFYRISYPIKRFGVETMINTPRYTTVFGVDDTSIWREGALFEKTSPEKPVSKTRYRCQPRPIPENLDLLRRVMEAATDTSYNICLVNYYATGNDSISYHSDDEHFLEELPAVASFSLGAQRDFLMKHKPAQDSKEAYPGTSTLKLSLSSGDMILMRGLTQPNWFHSIPKRKGAAADNGRINITLRKAMIPAGTENYYRYNVGSGDVYRWDEIKKAMVRWEQGRGV
jgi:alkylated DNA repair dioxygenase AlkB